jgi:hypothetical protein
VSAIFDYVDSPVCVFCQKRTTSPHEFDKDWDSFWVTKVTGGYRSISSDSISTNPTYGASADMFIEVFVGYRY